MIKVPQKHHPVYIAAISTLYVGLIVCVLWLAAISQSTGFWVVAILIDLAIIALGVRIFYKLFKPRIVSKPIKDVLDFSNTITEEKEVSKVAENNESKG